MRAVRIHEHGGPEVLRHEEVEVPGITASEVLVKVKAAGICGSDLHFYHDTPEALGARVGVVVGHGRQVSSKRSDRAYRACRWEIGSASITGSAADAAGIAVQGSGSSVNSGLASPPLGTALRRNTCWRRRRTVCRCPHSFRSRMARSWPVVRRRRSRR